MPIYCQPPVQQVAEAATELPLAPGSDPVILGAYRWALAHSPSLQQVVQKLARADRKARYRLLPGLDRKYSFWISPTDQEYVIDVEVPVLGWRWCGDALEAWIASSLFLVLEVVGNEKYRAYGTKEQMTFLQGSIAASFAFQNRVKQELEKADPERLKDLPDGAGIYAAQFNPRRGSNRKQRALPGGHSSDGSSRQSPPAGTSVAVVDRPITLPPLPVNGEQGRRAFRAIHGQISQAQEDLNRALPGLYANPMARLPLPAEISVPSDQRAEAVALVGILADPEFTRLERVYLDTWKGWQAGLIEGGLATPVHPSTPNRAPDSREYQAARLAAQQVQKEPSLQRGVDHRLDPEITRQEQKAGRGKSKLDAGYLDDLENTPSKMSGKSGTYESGVDDRWHPDELLGYIRHENDVLRSLAGQAVANRLLIDLAATWNPLVNHLNTVAGRLLELERTPVPGSSAALQGLRLQARLALFERFRRALWYCDLVWCQIASNEAPPPPQTLSPSTPAPLERP